MVQLAIFYVWIIVLSKIRISIPIDSINSYYINNRIEGVTNGC
jgi:hypothetical protein